MAQLSRTQPNHRGCCPELTQASSNGQGQRLGSLLSSSGSSRVEQRLSPGELSIQMLKSPKAAQIQLSCGSISSTSTLIGPDGGRRSSPYEVVNSHLQGCLRSLCWGLVSCSVYFQGRGREPFLHLSPQDQQPPLRCPVTLI